MAAPLLRASSGQVKSARFARGKMASERMPRKCETQTQDAIGKITCYATQQDKSMLARSGGMETHVFTRASSAALRRMQPQSPKRLEN